MREECLIMMKDDLYKDCLCLLTSSELVIGIFILIALGILAWVRIRRSD